MLARLRDDARAIANAAIEAVRPDALLEPAMRRWRRTWPASGAPPVTLIAAGKAAGPMVRACLEADVVVAAGLVATTHLDEAMPSQIEVHLAGHPVPTESSARAASRALALAGATAIGDTVIVLLSGGASALLAAPAHDLRLDDKVQTTRALLEAGAAIHELNTVRKHLSAVKGGQLAAAVRGASMTWALSDVVGPIEDDPSVIGSGPTVADPTTFGDALAVVERLQVRGRLPAGVIDALEAGRAGRLPETPKPADPRLARARFETIGGRRHAMAGAVAEANRRGYVVRTIDEPVVGEAREAGPAIVARAREIARDLAKPCCLVAAGETTVRVVGRGRGGRNQELALAAAPALAGVSWDCVLLSVGTDGVDGPTDAAGAIADTGTCDRAREAGVGEVTAYLADNDAYHFFDRLGDLVRTGPTHTNVGDLQVVLLTPP